MNTLDDNSLTLSHQVHAVHQVNGAKFPISTIGLRLRRVNPIDIPVIVQETKAFCATHPFYSKLPFSEAKLTWVLEKNVENPANMFCDVVCTPDDQPIGGLAAMTSGYAMADARYSIDLFQFIKPAYRQGIAFTMLISSYVKWAKEIGVHNAQLSYTGEKDEAMTRILKKWGFDRFGTMYLKLV